MSTGHYSQNPNSLKKVSFDRKENWRYSKNTHSLWSFCPLTSWLCQTVTFSYIKASKQLGSVQGNVMVELVIPVSWQLKGKLVILDCITGLWRNYFVFEQQQINGPFYFNDCSIKKRSPSMETKEIICAQDNAIKIHWLVSQCSWKITVTEIRFHVGGGWLQSIQHNNKGHLNTGGKQVIIHISL